MKWTTEQQKVIDLRNRNILVSAAAGSGKTAVLVERIIQMVTDPLHPVDIDRLLIVTFTSAAAGEMRERIGAAIEKRLAEDKDNLHLQKQMTLIHSAQITTIHSFCLSIIRNYFNQIDLDPGFRIGDEAELRLMKSDVLAKVLEERYEEADEAFLEFVESYATGKSDTGLEDMVLRLYEFSMSHPEPMEWLEGTKAAFQVEDIDELNETIWMKELLAYTKRIIACCVEDNGRAKAICEEGNGPYMYEDALQDDLEFYERLLRCETYEDYEKTFGLINWKRLSSKKDPTVDPDKREMVKTLRNRAKDNVTDIQKQYFFQPFEESLSDMMKVRPVVEALVALTEDFSQMFAAAKQEKNLLDFNDLEHFALKILIQDGKPSPVALELQEYYEEILVDEYQDSNLVQETLTSVISREESGIPNRFMVGDVKQSIYKFRLARPKLFIEKYDTYTTTDSTRQRIDLHQNFRSRASVLESINRVFEMVMHRALGEIEYDEDAALYAGASFEPVTEGSFGGKTEVLLLDGKEEIEEAFTSKEQEAQVIATRIKQLIEENYQVYDKELKAYRRVEFQDIVILLRSMTGWAEEYATLLGARGIPAYADTQTGYFSAIEVRVILNFLLIIDNPMQDIPLTSVLRSQIGGFTDEELSQIRILDMKSTMYQSLLKYAGEDGVQCDLEESNDASVLKEKNDAGNLAKNQELVEKVKDFLEMLRLLRHKVPYTSVYELLQEIYRVSGYYDYVSILPAGNIRKGNLDMLLQKALDFEGTSYSGLFHFNRYIEKLHQYDIDFGEAGVGGGKNAIRIMSIHKSKGLEFPVVFVGGMGKTFNQQDSRSRLIFHPDMGIGPEYVDYELRTKVPTLLKKVIQKTVVLESLAEELRILYVAMTRAKEKLILVGMAKDRTKKLGEWNSQVTLGFGEISSATSYLDWVMPCALHHEEEFDVKYVALEDMVIHEIREQLDMELKKETLVSWSPENHLTKEQKEQIDYWMNYQYPYAKEQCIKSKISVSELKHRAYEELEEAREEMFTLEEKEAYVPNFRQETEEISGTRRGTLYHKIMECLTFEKSHSLEEFAAELRYLAETGRIPMEDVEKVNIRKFLQFEASSLGKRMIKAAGQKQLFKEQPFVLGIPASRIYPDIESEEPVIVQGIIDAFFEENEELVLLDYKTDRVSTEQELIDRYKAQLDYYQEALEQITGQKVKERVIYSFYLEKEILV